MGMADEGWEEDARRRSEEERVYGYPRRQGPKPKYDMGPEPADWRKREKMTTRDEIEEAAEYAGLVREVSMLTRPRGDIRDLERRVFLRLGHQVRFNDGRFQLQEPRDGHWQEMPQILRDFGTAVAYTIGHRHGTLDHPLENNWYIREMCETVERVDGGRIAAWAIRLHKNGKPLRDAVGITPAAALVGAWLLTHKN